MVAVQSLPMAAEFDMRADLSQHYIGVLRPAGLLTEFGDYD